MAMSPSSSEANPTQRYDTPSSVQSVEARWMAALDTPVPYGVPTGRAVRCLSVSDGHGMAQLRLGFLPLDEWDEYNSYDEEIPSRLRYSIEWKVVLNNKVVSRDTEQDVVLAPGIYWHLCLKTKVEKLWTERCRATGT